MEPTELTAEQQREQYAQNQKHIRENTLTALGLPNRKKGTMSRLYRVAVNVHELLITYDALDDSSLSAHYSEVFSMAVEGMRQQLPAPAPAAPASPTPAEG